MADVERVRRALLACLRESLPAETPEGHPSVLDPSVGPELWAEATLAYNLRLADAVGPIALVYRMTSTNDREGFS
jgi:hypothetical protein